MGIEETDEESVPLHIDAAADPAGWGAIVGSLHFHAAVQVNGALAVLVVAEGLEGQGQQGRLLLGKHSRHLTLGGAMDTGVGPVLFPAVQITLGILQALEAQPLQRSTLGMADS